MLMCDMFKHPQPRLDAKMFAWANACGYYVHEYTHMYMWSLSVLSIADRCHKRSRPKH